LSHVFGLGMLQSVDQQKIHPEDALGGGISHASSRRFVG
jgi:hypothetical protein